MLACALAVRSQGHAGRKRGVPGANTSERGGARAQGHVEHAGVAIVRGRKAVCLVCSQSE